MDVSKIKSLTILRLRKGSFCLINKLHLIWLQAKHWFLNASLLSACIGEREFDNYPLSGRTLKITVQEPAFKQAVQHAEIRMHTRI